MPFTSPVSLTVSAGKQGMRSARMCILNENVLYITWSRRDKPRSRSYRRAPIYRKPEPRLEACMVAPHKAEWGAASLWTLVFARPLGVSAGDTVYRLYVLPRLTVCALSCKKLCISMVPITPSHRGIVFVNTMKTRPVLY